MINKDSDVVNVLKNDGVEQVSWEQMRRYENITSIILNN